MADEIGKAIGNSLLLAGLASMLAFSVGGALGVAAGYRNGTGADRAMSALAIAGVSIPHYWLGIVLVAIFSARLNWLPAMGAGPQGSGNWTLDHVQYIVLPVLTLAAMPGGHRDALGARAGGRRAATATSSPAWWPRAWGAAPMFRHLLKNIAPTALAVCGVQMGYLMAGSILVETVFSWPGTGLLLNTAILQRDIPLLQGTIFVLALFFVGPEPAGGHGAAAVRPSDEDAS